MNRNIVVLANGEFPSHPIPLQVLNDANEIYCCDGAIFKLEAYAACNPLSPKQIFVVGDGDTFPRQQATVLQSTFVRMGCTMEFHWEQEQEYNDLTKTVRYAMSRGVKQLTFLGATGLREDHTLGNISLLLYYSSQLDVRMLTDHGTFTPIDSTTSFSSFPRQQVSIFSLVPTTILSARGLEYPIVHRTFRQLWEGTLNSALGDEFVIEIEAPEACGVPSDAGIVVFQTYDPK